MSPYAKPLKPISSVAAYFEDRPDGSKIFTGQSLEIRIPQKFSGHGMLTIGDGNITTLGVFDMIIDDTYHVALNLLGSITCNPSDIGSFTYDGIDYATAMFKHGDVFMTATRILQDKHVVYVLWTEWVSGGNIAYWIEYKHLLAVFEHVKELTGDGIGVGRSVFEAIIAHLARDEDDVRIAYRLTDMTKPMRWTALKSISTATSNTSSKLIGSYFKDDGLTSALRYESDQHQPFENLLRGLPTHIEQS
jgi:hypothetical protein